jgi:hypothetical protein
MAAGVVAGCITHWGMFAIYTIDDIELSSVMKSNAFPWRLCIGTVVASSVGNPSETPAVSTSNAQH